MTVTRYGPNRKKRIVGDSIPQSNHANAGIRRKEGEMQCPYCQRILTKTDTADGYTLTCLVHGIIYQSHYTG